MVDDDGQDGRQLLRLGVLGEVVVPDAQDVAEQPQDHERLDAALVLVQDVDARFLAPDADGVEHVRVPEAERLVDEGAGHHFERGPIDARGDGRRQQHAQVSSRVHRVGERGFEERVVGLGLGHRRAPTVPGDGSRVQFRG
ncbi:MAG: hypothetical protein QM820_26770 [Minicystis sp.]